MNGNNELRNVVPGIEISATGQATVDPAMTEVLIELALKLEEPAALPVDVEHVLAAIVLALRNGELDSNRALDTNDPSLHGVLLPHVQTIFRQFGGKLGTDD